MSSLLFKDAGVVGEEGGLVSCMTGLGAGAADGLAQRTRRKVCSKGWDLAGPRLQTPKGSCRPEFRRG